MLKIQSNLSIGAGDFNQGPVGGGQGQQPVRMALGGGITARIQAATSRFDDATIKRELDWQDRVEGEAGKCNPFWNQALNQQGFHTFAFMKGKLLMLHMAHSVGTFFGMLGLATDVQGKQIGFVGDRGIGRHPPSLSSSLRKTCGHGKKTRYLQDTASFVAFYADENNKDKLLLTGADDDELTEAPLPRLLALPTFVAEFLGKQEGACIPHKLRKFVLEHINEGESQLQPVKWQLVLDWCLAAAEEKDRTSLLSIGAPEPALCQDPEFLKRCELRLATTLVPETRPTGGRAQGGGGPATGQAHHLKHGLKLPGRRPTAGPKQRRSS